MEKSLHTENWPSLLPQAVMQLNSRSLTRLNGLAPKDIISQWDDYKVQQAATQSANTAGQPRSEIKQSTSQSRPDLNQQLANQKAYEANPKMLQVGSYVYVDNKPKSFAKSFLPKASSFWISLTAT
jgi:hypothetical protein